MPVPAAMIEENDFHLALLFIRRPLFLALLFSSFPYLARAREAKREMTEFLSYLRVLTSWDLKKQRVRFGVETYHEQTKESSLFPPISNIHVEVLSRIFTL